MAEFPALTLWTDAYLSDTRHLSTLEHGAYLLLLMEAWRRPNCDLPEDDRILARLAGLSGDEWAAAKDIVMAFWTYDGRSKTYRQKRLLKERDAARKRSKSQRDKATKRWDNSKKDDAAAQAGQCPDDASTATATAICSEEANASSAAAAAQPDFGELDLGDERPPPAPSLTAADISKSIFDTGRSILKAAGVSDRQAGSVIGRWRKTYSDSIVLTALSRCQIEQPSEPVEWITKALQFEARKSSGQANGSQFASERRGIAELAYDVAREFEGSDIRGSAHT